MYETLMALFVFSIIVISFILVMFYILMKRDIENITALLIEIDELNVKILLLENDLEDLETFVAKQYKKEV